MPTSTSQPANLGISGKKVTALGLEDNPAGQYLLVRQPAIFQGVSTAAGYRERVNGQLTQLREDIAGGKFLNTGINVAPYEAQYGRPLTVQEEQSKLVQFRKMQKDVQVEWVDYLAEGGYSSEVQTLLLSAVVKEMAQQGEGGSWKFLTLGKNSERLPDRASPELASRFAYAALQPENWDKRPAQVLGEVAAELERETREQRVVETGDMTVGGDALRWVKFPAKSKDPKNFDANVQALTALAKTSGHFGKCTWCTGTGAAHGQLSLGDFWVGVDDQGKARVAVRMQGEKIGEIRGVLAGQNLEPKYASQTLSLVDSEGLQGGERFVTDAKIKGSLASLPKGASWEDYRQALGVSSDQEALDMTFHYKSPGYSRERLLIDPSRTDLLETAYGKAHDLGYAAPPEHLVGIDAPWVTNFVTPETLVRESEDPKDNLLRKFVRVGNFHLVAPLVSPEMLQESGAVEEAFLSGRAKDIEPLLTAEMMLPDSQWFKRAEQLGDKKPLWQTTMQAGTFAEYRRIFVEKHGPGGEEKLEDLLHWDLRTEYGTINGVMYAATQAALGDVKDFVRPTDYGQRDKNNRHLCHYAFAFGEVEAIDTARPETMIPDGMGRLPLHYGLRHGWYEKIKDFCTPQAIKWQDRERKTPMHIGEHLFPFHWMDQKKNARWEELKARAARPWDKEYELLTEEVKSMVDGAGQTTVTAAVLRGNGAQVKDDAKSERWKAKDESNPIFNQAVYGRDLEPVKEHLTRENLIGSASLTAIVRDPVMLRQVMHVLDEEVLTTPCLDSYGNVGTYPAFELARAGLLDKVMPHIGGKTMNLQDVYGDRLLSCVLAGKDADTIENTLDRLADKGLLTEEVMTEPDGRGRTPEEVAKQFTYGQRGFQKHMASFALPEM